MIDDATATQIVALLVAADLTMTQAWTESQAAPSTTDGNQARQRYHQAHAARYATIPVAATALGMLDRDVLRALDDLPAPPMGDVNTTPWEFDARAQIIDRLRIARTQYPSNHRHVVEQDVLGCAVAVGRKSSWPEIRDGEITRLVDAARRLAQMVPT